MDFRQCNRCDGIFEYRGRIICPTCIRELDEIFVEVRNYIYEHSNATLDEIIDNTSAEEKEVIGWLQEGRLIMSADAPPMLKCDCCGVPIREGRFCDRCMTKLRNEIAAKIEPADSGEENKNRKPLNSKPGQKMHVSIR